MSELPTQERRIAARMQAVRLSPTLAFEQAAHALRAQGRDIVVLGAGEPDFPTPAPVVDAALAAARAGQTRYTPMAGTAALREAIAAKLQRDHGLRYGLDQIIVSSGAKQSLFNLMMATLSPGDELLLPTPGWVSYADIARLAGAGTVRVPTTYEQGYLLQPEALAAAITPRSRLLVLNSPCNPTGARHGRSDWLALGRVLAAHPQLLVVCDDIYEKILLDDEPFVHWLQACPGLYDRTVVINGVSKAYAMTGWRIGYAAGPRDLVEAMERVQSQVTSCASSVSQAAALAALNLCDEPVLPMRAAFRERHAQVLQALQALPGLRCRPARGGFYLLLDATTAVQALKARGAIARADDADLAHWLLREHGLGLVPGSAFGAAGCLRLSFAASPQILQAAMSRLACAWEVLQ
ncbi:Aspartate aminotransferase [Delftia tsuruhatensis]|uniref:pyridoxal phosphate-dependent aminotransferase n=1 Tax=Delftia tsuruhatensis TaxID=180282 RepID=UPI001E73141C|nr:pyridoxal phosphate-dependent aminotransferase [Delftia tsuruhatensis]CAB5686252.1 Aspartate aminotransferase [Delftia tsuruhatensis]CAC9690373.1 Aspartate aminotransferase [Delftia tsuruhatensis]